MLKKGQQSLEFCSQPHRSIAIRNVHPDMITLVLGGQWIAEREVPLTEYTRPHLIGGSFFGEWTGVGFMVGSGYRNRRRLGLETFSVALERHVFLKAEQVYRT
jgi:hypothetical protein